MPHPSPVRWGVLVAAAMSTVSPALHAGVRRDDVADSVHTTMAAEARYAQVGALLWEVGSSTYIGSGSLLTPRWVLTAAHCVDGSKLNMRWMEGANAFGTPNAATRWFAHPSWTGSLTDGYDIGLVYLGSARPATPAARFTGADERGLVGTSVGYGATGVGSTGATLSAGTKRAGQNMIDIWGGTAPFAGHSNRILAVDFDRPGVPGESSMGANTPLANEYLIAGGDSGGGVYVDVSGVTFLAGVHSFLSWADGTGNADYGDRGGSIRVSQFNSWIDDTISHAWTNAAGGSFATVGNWGNYPDPGSPAIPGVSDIAGFNINNTYTVTSTGTRSNFRLLARQGHVTLNLGGGTYNLTGTNAEGSIVVGKYSGNSATVSITNGTSTSVNTLIGELAGSTGVLNVNSTGVLSQSQSIYVGGSTILPGGTGTLNVNAGGVANVTGTVRVYAGGTLNVAGSLSAQRVLSEGNVSITGSGAVTINTNGGVTGTSRVNSLSIAAGAKLDLKDNDLVVTGMSAGSVRSLLVTGFNSGDWAGNGLTSSTAENDSSFYTALGYADNAELGYATFSGQSVSGTDILVKYTFYGDSDLNGVVDADDLTNWIDGFNGVGSPVWLYGDFDYSGVVDADDLTLWVDGFLNTVGPLSASLQAEIEAALVSALTGGDYQALHAVASSVVPEPASLSLLGLGALALRRRRR